jgi:hypothetical protein
MANAAYLSAPISRARQRTGAVMAGLAILFLSVDALGKVLRVAPVVEGTVRLGYPETVLVALGIIELACVAAYAAPRTSVLGAILLTGYLGGAIATHVRIGSPLLTHTLFPIYVAALVWGALYLREDRLTDLMPLRR